MTERAAASLSSDDVWRGSLAEKYPGENKITRGYHLSSSLTFRSQTLAPVPPLTRPWSRSWECQARVSTSDKMPRYMTSKLHYLKLLLYFIQKVEFHEKDFRAKTLIKEAIMENDFLKNLSPPQVKFLQFIKKIS